MPEPTLHVRLFGPLDLRLGDRPLAPIESARARSLLAQILLHPDVPQSRQHLSFVLWPDSTEGQARTNLRNLLHTLRRTNADIDRILELTPQTVQRRPDLPCRVDVTDFTAALADADAAEPGSDVMVAALRQAVGLYAGDLLEACYDEWLVEERERLRDRYVSALRRLTAALADGGEYAEAVRLGRDLLRTDPLHEDTYRLLMHVHAAAGDRAGAVRTYHECAAVLRRELGVDPSPATRAAYEALTRVEVPDAAGPTRVEPTVLIGRRREWDQLVARWREADAGRPHLVLVTGEPGIGKTRLVEELSTSCTHGGALVAHARSYPAEGDLGYGVVISWLKSPALAGHLRRAGEADLGELARLLPELGAGPPGTGETADDAGQRRRLFDAVARTLVAAERPTLLVADDAQWCDAQSLQLVHYLLRRDGGRVLVVATVRREEVDDGHPLTEVAGALQAIDRASEIPLARFGRADTETLARQLTGDAYDAAESEALFTDSEGNPLFIVESIRARAGAGGDPQAALTPKLQAVIGARLRQLSDPARQVLTVAAVVGREFTAELVAAGAALDDLSLVRGLDELWRRGVIREHGTDAYDFSHGRIRDVAYEALSPAARRRTHALVAEALARTHAEDLDPVSGQIAGHFDQAGRPPDAVTWYRRAAVRAQRIHANVEAVGLLTRADALVATLPGENQRRQELEILSALPAPLGSLEGFTSERLAGLQRRALELAHQLGVEPSPPLLRSLVMSSLCLDDFDGARAAGERLRTAADAADDEGLRIESDYLLGITAFWGGRFETARSHFEAVVARFSPARRGEHIVRFGHDPAVVCLSRLANTLWFLGRTDDARHARDEAVALGIESGHPLSRTVAHVFAAVLAVDLGEPDRVRAYADALRAEDHLAHPSGFITAGLTGLLEVVDGRPTDGIERIRAALDASGTTNAAPGARPTLLRVLVAAHELAGDAPAGLAAADDALAAGGARTWESEVRRARAVFLSALGRDAAEVEAELTRAVDVARDQGAAGLVRRIELTGSRLLAADRPNAPPNASQTPRR